MTVSTASKLRPAQRERVRVMLASGLSQREIARVFSVSQPAIAYWARRFRRASRDQLEASPAIKSSVRNDDRTAT